MVKHNLLAVVSQRVDRVQSRGELRDALDQDLVRWLIEVGLLVMPVPNLLYSKGKLDEYLDSINPQAIVLSGGNDIGVYEDRDKTEFALLKYAESKDLPVLGICRGMQVLSVYGGQKLIKVVGHTGTKHILNREKSELEVPSEVNSYHDWAVENCPSDYEVLALTDDGVLEAIRHLSRSWEGWMWHPEREQIFSPVCIKRARKLFALD